MHFGGHTTNKIVSLDCCHTSEREESFLAISLLVKDMQSLEESMESFVKDELLEGDDMYFCGEC